MTKQTIIFCIVFITWFILGLFYCISLDIFYTGITSALLTGYLLDWERKDLKLKRKKQKRKK